MATSSTSCPVNDNVKSILDKHVESFKAKSKEDLNKQIISGILYTVQLSLYSRGYADISAYVNDARMTVLTNNINNQLLFEHIQALTFLIQECNIDLFMNLKNHNESIELIEGACKNIEYILSLA